MQRNGPLKGFGLILSFFFFFKAQEAVLSNLSNVMYTDYSNNKKKMTM